MQIDEIQNAIPPPISTVNYQEKVFDISLLQQNPSENAEQNKDTCHFTLGPESIEGSKCSQNKEEKSANQTAQSMLKLKIKKNKDEAPKIDAPKKSVHVKSKKILESKKEVSENSKEDVSEENKEEGSEDE